jgi:putative endonuclease
LTTQRQAIGRWGEDIAAKYLETLGYTILVRNVHTPHGELDIIASRNQLLVFVEVKTRTSHSFAFPEDSVTARKQAHMLSAAEMYIDQHPECGDTWQFDVSAVEGKPGDKAQIEHFENVIG